MNTYSKFLAVIGFFVLIGVVLTRPVAANDAITPIEAQIARLEPLCQKLKQTHDLDEKLRLVTAVPDVQCFLRENPALWALLATHDRLDQFVAYAIMALGQGPVVFQDYHLLEDVDERLQALLSMLKELEKSYSLLGGIVGYHLTFLKLIVESGVQNTTKTTSYKNQEKTE